MGTLFNQDPRKSLHIEDKEIINEIEILKKIASKTKLSIDQVIKISEIKQLERKNNLYVSNGDIHDEQMSGIGLLLDKIDSSLERLAIAVENHGS
jgi:hypothetical protein